MYNYIAMKNIKYINTFLCFVFFVCCVTVNAVAMSSKPSEPDAECMYGVFMSNRPVNIYRTNKFEVETGKKAAMIMFYMDWRGNFPTSDCLNIVEYGAIPHVTWEPWIIGEDVLYLDNILNGEWDSYIEQWAQSAKEFKYPFFLRVGHEMNGNWYPWSGYQNDKDPKKFVAAYKHIYDIFKEVGADNAIWIWCPMDTEVPHSKWNYYTNYYPGDEYVDWIGLDGYNWGNTQNWSHWTSFRSIFKKRYDEIVELYPSKPIMIGEFGSAQRGGDKAQWIKDAFTLIKEEMPQLKAIVWFNINKECDWRVESSPESLEAFKEVIKDPYYGSNPDSFSKLIKKFKLPEGAVTQLSLIKRSQVDLPQIEISKVCGDIVVDGDLSEWSHLKPVVLDDERQIDMGYDDWQGVSDLSARIYLMWDSSYLYLAAIVKDDSPLKNIKSRENIWDGDGIELAIGVDPESDPERSSYDATDYQLCLAMRLGGGNWSWQLQKAFDTIESKVSKAEDGFSGYIYEAKIPWSEFNFVPQNGMKLKFNIALNDADKTQTRETQMVFSGYQDFYEDPSQWGWLLFSE